MKKAIIILVACTAMSCVSCSQQPPTEPVQITLMHGWGGSGADHVAMRKIYADFEAENPDISVVYDALPDISVLIDKAGNMLAADKMSNIISTNGYTGFVANARKKGLALNLSPYIENDSAFAQNIGKSVLDAWSDEDGSIYTLPDVQENIGYWYNEDVFRKAGITKSGSVYGTVALPKTWDEFWQACDKIKENAEAGDTLPMMMQRDQMRILLGARLAASDNSSRLFMQRSAEACEAQDVKTAVQDLIRAASYYSGEPLSVSDARAMFFDGKSAIYFNGVWANTDFGQTNTGQNIKYAPFPTNAGESIAYISPASGYVLSNTGSREQIDACIRFLKYMLRENVQQSIVSQTRQAPSNAKVTPEWIESKVPILGQALMVCNSADVKILSLYNVLGDKNSSLLDTCLDELLRGKVSEAAFISVLANNGGTP